MGSRQQHRRPAGAKGRGNNASARGGIRSKAKSRDLAANRKGGGSNQAGRTRQANDDRYRTARGSVLTHQTRMIHTGQDGCGPGYRPRYAASVDLHNGNGRARIADGAEVDWATPGLARQKAIQALKALYFREPYTARIDRTLPIPPAP